MSQVLSQQEVDLLIRELDGFESLEDSVEASPYGEDEVVPYDLSHPDRVIRGRMPTLELIHEHFSRIFRQTLSNHMRRPIGVSVRSTELVNFKDYLKSISHPTSVNIFHMAPLRGSALMVLERRLVFIFIDLLFGGSGGLEAQLPTRDFTNIEIKMVTKVVHSALEDYQTSWKPVVPLRLKFIRSESNPQFASVMPESEIVVLTTFDVEINNSPMSMSVCLPYTMLDPIRSRLSAGYQSDHAVVNQAMVSRLEQSVSNSAIQVRVPLGKAKMSLRKFLKLEVGDLIHLNQESGKPLDVIVEDVVKYRGIQGSYKGHMAVKITELVYEPKPKYSWLDGHPSEE